MAMPKNVFPMETGGGVLRKVAGVLVALAVLALVVKHPNDAATWVSSVFRMLGGMVDGISEFLREVLG
jgi:hypothetical protein